MERLCLYAQNNVLGARLILLGDFNLPDVNWQTFEHHSPSADMLFELMLSLNLSQIVTEPTRVQGTTSNTLDLVFLTPSFPV